MQNLHLMGDEPSLSSELISEVQAQAEFGRLLFSTEHWFCQTVPICGLWPK